MTASGKLHTGEFFSHFKPLTFAKGAVIIRPEDIPGGVYFIESGYAKLYTISPDGRELTLNIFKPGSYFSMLWALGEVPNTYYFQAMTEVKVLRAPREKILEYLKSEPEELYDFTRRILIGMGGILTRMEYLLSGNAHGRVAAVLLSLAKRFGKPEGTGVVIELPLTHQEIASLAGLTRETTSLEMERLEKDGIVGRHGKLFSITSVGDLEEELLIEKAEESFPAAV